MTNQFKIFSIKPMREYDGECYTVNAPINIFFLGVENGYNIYVEQPDNSLQFISGLQKKDGSEVPEEVLKEFAEAAAEDELIVRKRCKDKSIINIETI